MIKQLKGPRVEWFQGLREKIAEIVPIKALAAELLLFQQRA